MSEDLLWGEIDDEERLKEARARLCEGFAVLASTPGSPKLLKSEEYADALMKYMLLVLEKEKDINLTAIKEPVEFVELHLLDSLSACILPEIIASNDLVDMGSGAGFPGMPLALLFPEKRFVLADAIRKRVDFLNSSVEEMNLAHVKAVHARAESIGQETFYRESFDVALCRAVASLPIALEYTMPLVRVGGVGVFYKTVQAEDEIKESKLALELLGADSDVRVVTNERLLPGRGHALYVVRKDRPTPTTYPRRDGKPKKAPL